jgi:hypothetical protein
MYSRQIHRPDYPKGGDVVAVTPGEIRLEMLRATFPLWRIAGHPAGWWAMRQGTASLDGPRSLIQHVHVAPDLTGLAEKLCLQEHLDGLDLQELAAVWREMALPAEEMRATG